MSIWSAEKRLLALDGGGVRGIISIAFLERIETHLKAGSGKGDGFRLADHFHLIGGTSTGAIIASALATGRTVAEIKDLYFHLAPRVFRRYWSRVPFLQARFVARPLADILASELGDMTLEDPRIRTHLAIVMKRIDTGSPWIVSTLRDQPYWADGADGTRPGNRHFRLADLVRASTAAPFFFGPEFIPVEGETTGNFIDGAVTPYGSPVLPLLMLATMRRYGLSWPLGAQNLSLVSVGTGRYRYRTAAAWTPAMKLAIDTLRGLMMDCQNTNLMLMQWLSESDAPWWLNSDIEDLAGDCLGGQPLMAFQRYDLLLERDWLNAELGLQLKESEIRHLRRLDRPSAMADLYRIASEAAAKQIPAPQAR